ncbi:MAG: metallophosphoesterase [Desulfobacterales bacterium]
MRIAIMSDSHDNLWNMRKALKLIQERNADLILHCGDFVAPFMLREMEQAGIPVHGVFGNNDGDRYLLTKLSFTELSHITLHGMAGELDLAGYRIAFAHERLKADGLVFSGKYDLVCFGHTHTWLQEKIGETLLLNPGEIMGKDGDPGFCFAEIPSGTVERISI